MDENGRRSDSCLGHDEMVKRVLSLWGPYSGNSKIGYLAYNVLPSCIELVILLAYHRPISRPCPFLFLFIYIQISLLDLCQHPVLQAPMIPAIQLGVFARH